MKNEKAEGKTPKGLLMALKAAGVTVDVASGVGATVGAGVGAGVGVLLPKLKLPQAQSDRHSAASNIAAMVFFI